MSTVQKIKNGAIYTNGKTAVHVWYVGYASVLWTRIPDAVEGATDVSTFRQDFPYCVVDQITVELGNAKAARVVEGAYYTDGERIVCTSVVHFGDVLPIEYSTVPGTRQATAANVRAFLRRFPYRLRKIEIVVER